VCPGLNGVQYKYKYEYSTQTLISTRGFSAGVNPDDFKGSYSSGYDPLWEDMLHLHEQKPFHCMVGGGDQIYGDPVTLEPELRSEPRTIRARSNNSDARCCKGRWAG
jgi:hypothetical protein